LWQNAFSTWIPQGSAILSVWLVSYPPFGRPIGRIVDPDQGVGGVSTRYRAAMAANYVTRSGVTMACAGGVDKAFLWHGGG
jgi:hypothetical protein